MLNIPLLILAWICLDKRYVFGLTVSERIDAY